MSRRLILFGTGEIAQLARFYFEQDSDYEVCGFVADDDYIEQDQFEGLPLVSMSQVTERFPPDQFDAHVALSYRKLNQIRQKKYEQMKKLGYTLASYVCSKSIFWTDLKHGDNCFILENQTIQPTVEIGNNVMIWSGNHLGHGSIIADHVYISSHVCISGHVKIGQRCFIGVNATIKDFVTLGDSVFVGMDASVTKDVKDDEVVLGARSENLDKDSKMARVIRKKYFKI